MTPSASKRPKPPARPRGRDAAIAAIVASARELYRNRSPAEVTMQEIADHAHVNRGLVHHYFGSKEDLFAAIFRVTSEKAAAEVREADDFLAGLAKTRGRRGYAQMVAWSLISGMDAADFVTRSPTMAELARQAEAYRLAGHRPAEDLRPFEPQFIVAAAIALSMGWEIFEPFLTRAAGLDDVPPADLRDELGRLIEHMVGATLPTGQQPPATR